MNTFEQLKIQKILIDNLHKNYIKVPTPIQSLAIPAIFDGRDLMAEADTGSGKTLAFLLPVIQCIQPDGPIQGLIIAPTRELAIQITQVAETMNPGLNILSVYGGQDLQSQMKKLNRSVQVIVATPGRLLDHLNRKNLDLKNLSFFVLDEVDQLLDMGFRDDIMRIEKYTAKNHQTIGFSATINKSIKKLAYNLMKDPVFLSTRESLLQEKIEQNVIFTKPRDKFDDLCIFLNKENPFLAIIFCRTRRRVDQLELSLHQAGFNCSKLHGGMPQSKRQKAMKAFKDLKIQYLVATEVAARGIDVTGVTHVINYDLPETNDSYVHRIGRTGRVDEKGKTYTFVNEEERPAFEAMKEALDIQLKPSD